MHPLVGQAPRVKYVERLKNADQIRDAREPISVEDAASVPLHLIEWPIADVAEQRAGILVARLPARHDIEKCPEGRHGETLAFLARAEIRHGSRPVSSGGIPQRWSQAVYSCSGVYLLQISLSTAGGICARVGDPGSTARATR